MIVFLLSAIVAGSIEHCHENPVMESRHELEVAWSLSSQNCAGMQDIAVRVSEVNIGFSGNRFGARKKAG